jgi:hypothetical protein
MERDYLARRVWSQPSPLSGQGVDAEILSAPAIMQYNNVLHKI